MSGPAFPIDPQGQPPGTEGMTMRDFFAAQALIALYGCPQFVVGLDKAAKNEGLTFKAAMAQHAYGMADEMLAERDRQE